MIYPKDHAENVRFRAEMLNKAEHDVEFQQVLIEACRRDRLFLFNVFLYTYDPRKDIKDIPFITYPYQDELILWDAECAEKGIDNLCEKSRDLGVTFCFCGNDLYDWLFNKQRIEIRWGSRKEQYVDTRGDMDSIFEKFRYMLRYLPVWMLPKGFSFKEHDNTMRLKNPDTESLLTGEATNANFGRGGRKYRIRFDEMAFWENDFASWKSCAASTNCRTALSTPAGSSNKFAQLANGTEEKIEKKTLHWTLHPEKAKDAYYLDKDGVKAPYEKLEDVFPGWVLHRTELVENMIGGRVRSPWYDMECNRASNTEIAQEQDIDYLMSGNPFYDMVALSMQKDWEYGVRPNPASGIPYGRYIRANLVQVNHKVKLMERPDGWLRVFELPKKERQYILAGDSSEGLPKGDKSAAVVKDKWTLNTMATINMLCPPEEFAMKLYLLSQYYDEALTAPENNSHGYTVCKDFNDLGGNLYFSRPEQSKSVVLKRGFSTTPQTRPLMLDQSAHNIAKHATELRDPDLIAQCKTFVCNENSGRPEADGKFNDDLVISNAICDYIIKLVPYKAPISRDKLKQAGQVLRQQQKNAGLSFT